MALCTGCDARAKAAFNLEGGTASHLGSSPYHKKYCWRSMSLFFKKMPQCNESVTLLFSCYFVTLLLHYFNCRWQERARRGTEFHLGMICVAKGEHKQACDRAHNMLCLALLWPEQHLYITVTYIFCLKGVSPLGFTEGAVNLLKPSKKCRGMNRSPLCMASGSL